MEHRYYGQSVPVGDYSTANLRWLSSEQALADLASFVGAMNAAHGLQPPANKWVAFGGSYPGMLACWLRLKYPHLVHAAVASSAPVRAVANFQVSFSPSPRSILRRSWVRQGGAFSWRAGGRVGRPRDERRRCALTASRSSRQNLTL